MERLSVVERNHQSLEDHSNSFREWLSEQDQRQRDLCNRDRKRVKIYNPLRS